MGYLRMVEFEISKSCGRCVLLSSVERAASLSKQEASHR